MAPLSRRQLLRAGLAATAALPCVLFPTGRSRAGAGGAVPAPAPPIRPRSDWGADLPPNGPLEVEQPDDVRFLLVHHSVSVNDYPPDAVPAELRRFYRLHTGPERGWPDVAYNFLVDRFGAVWEGRAGSLEAPVKGDATGGSQGFALLCCFIGDHRTVPPSPEAQASMVALLAWLAGRYGIDPRPLATTTFVSRGSNRWPAGTAITTTTIAGHRDMSRTECPGDAAYRLVREEFPLRVSEAMDHSPATETVPATAPPSSTSAPAASPDLARPRSPAGSGPGWPLPVAAAAGLTAATLAIRRRAKGRSAK